MGRPPAMPPRTAVELRAIYADLLSEHRRWLTGFGRWRVTRWESLLESQPEPAIFEAAVRRLLGATAQRVEPGEDRRSGGPDFCCNRGDFYVEATCISIASATEATGLSDRGSEVGSVGRLAGRLGEEIQAKLRQASRATEAPTLVAVGTLHFLASMVCFDKPLLEWTLVGAPVITTPISMETGGACGPTRIEHDIGTTPFMILGEDAASCVTTWRRAVSGVLLLSARSLVVSGSPGSLAEGATGLLHPDPLLPFDRRALPAIRFLRLGDGWREGRAVCEDA